MLDYNTLNALVEKKLANGEIEKEIKNTIIPNPTLVGDEENLDSVEIKGVKYKVGGSEVHLYKHHIKIGGYNQNYDNANLYVSFDIYLSTNTPLTFENVKSWLIQNGYDDLNNLLAVVSRESVVPLANVDKHIVIGIYGTSSWLYTLLQYTSGTNSGNVVLTFFQLNNSCTDTITQIF